jgi:hypothetical protein
MSWSGRASRGRPGPGRPHEGETAGLAGQPPDDLDSAAGFAEGALDEVGVPYPVVVLGGEAQVGGQAFGVGGQALTLPPPTCTSASST